MKSKAVNLRALTLIAMLAALSAVLMLLNPPLPFFPPFLKIDIAGLPALFAGFFFGPGAAAAVVVLKTILELALAGTETMYLGELMSVINGLGYVLPAAFIYKVRKDIRGARISLLCSTIMGSVLATLMNLWIAFPMYSSLYGMPIEAIVGMGSSVNPLIGSVFSLLLLGVFPFNLIKLLVTSLATWLLYKRVGAVLRPIIYRAAS